MREPVSKARLMATVEQHLRLTSDSTHVQQRVGRGRKGTTEGGRDREMEKARKRGTVVEHF